MGVPDCWQDLFDVSQGNGTTFNCGDLADCDLNDLGGWPASNNPCQVLQPDGAGGYVWGNGPVAVGPIASTPVPGCDAILVDPDTGLGYYSDNGGPWTPFGGAALECVDVCECIIHRQDFSVACCNPADALGVRSQWVPVHPSYGDWNLQSVCITATQAGTSDVILALIQRCNGIDTFIGFNVFPAGQTVFCGNIPASTVPAGCQLAVEFTQPTGSTGTVPEGLFVALDYTKTCT